MQARRQPKPAEPGWATHGLAAAAGGCRPPAGLPPPGGGRGSFTGLQAAELPSALPLPPSGWGTRQHAAFSAPQSVAFARGAAPAATPTAPAVAAAVAVAQDSAHATSVRMAGKRIASAYSAVQVGSGVLSCQEPRAKVLPSRTSPGSLESPRETEAELPEPRAALLQERRRRRHQGRASAPAGYSKGRGPGRLPLTPA